MKIGESNYIQQLQLHNEDALVYVIEEYGGLLKAVIRKHLFLMPQKQEECLNDVLLSIWEHIASFDGRKSSFKNWAAAVARYQAIDYLRKYQRELQQTGLESVAAAKEDARLLRLVEDELSEEMEAMLACLKPKDREIFRRLYVEEETIEQIGREMRMEKAAVYNHLSRGKARIRKHYFKEGRV